MGNWKFVNLGEEKIVDLIMGQSPPSSSYNKKRIGLPFFQGKKEFGELYPMPEVWCDKPNKVSQVGDILLSVRAPVGPTNLTNETCCIGRGLAAIRPNPELLNTKFLLYFFKNFEMEIVSKGQGSTFQAISGKELRNLRIPLPLISEQLTIVEKLDSFFEKIDKSIVLLEENLKHSKALMGSILDEVFTNLENTSNVVKISEIADIKGGKRLPKGEQLQNTKTDYPYIRVTDFNDNGSIDVDNIKYMTKEIQSKISRYIITSNDLYISIAGTIGKTGIIPKELDGANLTENAARFVYKDKKSISNKFVYYYTKSDKFKAFVDEATKQVAQPKLALTRLNEIELALPSITEQEKAVAKFIEMQNALSKMGQEIHIKIDNMKALKSSLLDQAFKGEL